MTKKKIIVVMPAYNAEQTLRKTVDSIDRKVVDEIILVDDASSDSTVEIGKELGLYIYRHNRNLGYGGNQKSCYRLALQHGADIVIMVHPDFQYDPRLIPAMSSMLLSGIYDVVLGSRILGGRAISGGMPIIKYLANRILTFAQNILINTKLSEFHTGYRAFTRQVLESLPLQENSDDFIFDNQMLCQIVAFGFCIGEISCPTRYFKEASSIPFRRSIVYGLGVIKVSLQLILHRLKIREYRLFSKKGLKLTY